MHENLNAFIKKVKPRNIYGLTTKGSIEYSNINFQTTDTLIFGPETRGLPQISERLSEKILAQNTNGTQKQEYKSIECGGNSFVEALRQTNFSLLKTGKTQ
ncbi:MAG: hypothetical protein CM15mP51_02120 [Porticoccaceae bacterium]|nr:MAG: hypothetical protein CM15mP51_02120 [Porticoccaceae bacterium]